MYPTRSKTTHVVSSKACMTSIFNNQWGRLNYILDDDLAAWRVAHSLCILTFWGKSWHLSGRARATN